MTAGGEPDLTEGTPVRVDLDEGEAIECTVFAFVGSVILARYDTAPDGNTLELLASGADGFLIVEQDRGVKALRASASLNGEVTLALRITDAFTLGQRRESTRVPLALDALLAPAGGDVPPTATRTIDISFGGVQVERTDATPRADRYALTLSGEPLGLPLVTEAALARDLPGALGLRFTRLEPDDRRRLIGLVLAHVTVPEGT